MNEWTAEELSILQQNMTLPAKKIATMINRTPVAIYRRIAAIRNCDKESITQEMIELVLKHAYIKSDEWIANLIGLPVYAVEEIKNEHFDKKNNRPKKYITLCVYCKNATGGCRWSRYLRPVKGWKAEEKIINYHRSRSKKDRGNAIRVLSYAVKECPEYRRG